MSSLAPWLRDHYSEALSLLRPFALGPGNTGSSRSEFPGQALASGDMLRSLAAKGAAILRDNPQTCALQTNWQQRVVRFAPDFNDARARWSGVTREDVVRGIGQSLDGRAIGCVQSGGRSPAHRAAREARRGPGQRSCGIARRSNPARERRADHPDRGQVVDGFRDQWDDPVIWRRDRKRTITLQANPVAGVTLPTYMKDVMPKFDALSKELPNGYKMEWGGEYENSTKSQQSLIPGIVPAVAVMLLIIVALFNAIQPALIIALTVPFAIVGMTVGLLGTGNTIWLRRAAGCHELGGDDDQECHRAARRSERKLDGR